MQVDKFNGPRSSLPVAPAGSFWVNKVGPNNEWTLSTLDEIDQMPVEDFMRWYGGGKRIAGAVDHQRWHERIHAPATTIAASAQGYDFFGKVPGDTEPSLDGGTTIAIDDYYTNMVEGGKMEKDVTFIVYALGIRVDIPHREFNAFTALQPVSAAVTSTDTSSATAHLLQLDRGAIFTFLKGGGTSAETVAQGSLFDFPSKGGPGGIASGNTVEGVMTNGNGFLNYLDEVVVLDEGRQFKLQMKTYRAMLSVLNVPVRPILYGSKIDKFRRN